MHFDEAQPDLIKSYQKGFVNEPSSPGGRLYVKADLVASKRPADSCTKVLSSKNPRLELLGSPLPITEEVIGSPRPRLLPSIQVGFSYRLNSDAYTVRLLIINKWNLHNLTWHCCYLFALYRISMLLGV